MRQITASTSASTCRGWKRAYLSRCELRFSEEPDVASWSAEDVSNKKSLDARMMLPFAVPVIMAAVTPLIQHGLGLTH